MATLRRAGPAGALALALIAGGCVVPNPGGTGDTVDAAPREPGAVPSCPPTRGALVLDRVNAIRAQHGLRRLAAQEGLIAAAAGHSEDLSVQSSDAIGHIGSDGSAPGDRVSAAGYEWRFVGENVAAGIPSPDAVVAGWMNSPPHRATILSPDPEHAGIGYVHTYSGRLNHFWTLVVAAPRDEGEGGVVACHP